MSDNVRLARVKGQGLLYVTSQRDFLEVDLARGSNLETCVPSDPGSPLPETAPTQMHTDVGTGRFPE